MATATYPTMLLAANGSGDRSDETYNNEIHMSHIFIDVERDLKKENSVQLIALSIKGVT